MATDLVRLMMSVAAGLMAKRWPDDKPLAARSKGVSGVQAMCRLLNASDMQLR